MPPAWTSTSITLSSYPPQHDPDLVLAGRQLKNVTTVVVRINHLVGTDDLYRYAGKLDRVSTVPDDTDHADRLAGLRRRWRLRCGVACRHARNQERRDQQTSRELA